MATKTIPQLTALGANVDVGDLLEIADISNADASRKVTQAQLVAILGTPASGTLTNCTGLPVSTGISGLGTEVATFLATPSSANLASAVTGETGSGALVFATSPQLTTNVTTDSTTFALVNTTATTVNAFGAATTLNIGASATCILNFGGSTTASEFRFLEPSGSGTNYTAFKAQAQGASITYTLPATVGAAGTVLTDSAGNGTLSWTAAGAGTVTVVGAGSLTSTALVTGGGTTTLQTPSATATMDTSGNIATPGSLSTGVGGSVAGNIALTQGTAPSAGTTNITIYAPSSVTSYVMALPGAAATGFYLGTNSAGTVTWTQVAANGTGNVVLTSGAALTSATITTGLVPTSNDGAALGSTSNQFSDLFLAEGGVINWDNGDATITQSGNTVTVAGAELIIDAASGPTSTTAAGLRGMTQNSQSAAYTTVLSDAGKHILHPTADNNARTFTIDSNANVAYPIGTAITFINQINTVTIAITSDTLTLYAGSGTGTTGSRTLAAGGVATATKISSTSWAITGIGLT